MLKKAKEKNDILYLKIHKLCKKLFEIIFKILKNFSHQKNKVVLIFHNEKLIKYHNLLI